MQILENKAKEIYEDMRGEKVTDLVQIDPTIIVTIIAVLVQLFKAFAQCKKSTQSIKSSLLNPGIIERSTMRRIVRRHVDYNLRSAVFHSSLKTAKNVSEDEIVKIMEEVK